MIAEKTKGSSMGSTGVGERSSFPLYGYIGLAVIIVGEIFLFSGNRFLGIYLTPIEWSGYIIFMDAMVKKLKGRSLISTSLLEFFLLALISIVSWLIFEAYNLLLHNWRYTGLPENPPARYIGYAWSFATISPAIFYTYEIIGTIWPDSRGGAKEIKPLRGHLSYIFITAGLALLILPILFPSPYMTPLVWIGFVFFLDPINGRIGERSILAELVGGYPKPLFQFFASGLFCGLLWEFWNYWATAKWEYNVPYFGDVKLFEMPILGFLGFLPFSIECFAIYKFIRRTIPIPQRNLYLE